MEIVHPLAQQYAERYTTAEEDLLKEIADFTFSNRSAAHMLSGHLQGKFLEMISTMIHPKRILEIGTFTGYSALCLAKGLQKEGQLHTIEVREEDAKAAKGFFDRSYFKDQILLHVGKALTVIEQLQDIWDLVFIDADKTGYVEYFNRIFPKVRKNGFILADNVLFHGQVLESELKGKNAKAIQAFNDMVLQRTDVEKILLPVRDGLYLIKKIV